MIKRVPSEAEAEAVRLAAGRMGQHLRSARQARRCTQRDAAWDSSLSLPTYKRMEAGDPSVALTYWLQAWRLFGLLDPLAEATAPHRDAAGERMRGFQRAASRVRRPSRHPDNWDY